MRLIISIVRYTALVTVTLILCAFWLANLFQPVYDLVFPHEVGGFGVLNFTSVAVWVASCHFFLPFLLLTLGDRFRYWAIAFVLVILGIFDHVLDPGLTGPLLAIGLSGLATGLLVRWISTKTLGSMPAMEKYKKFF
jgi:hypothetical protein